MMKKTCLLLILLSCFTVFPEHCAGTEDFFIGHTGKIIPAPQKAEYSGYIKIQTADEPGICVVVGNSAPELDMLSAGLISRAVYRYSGLEAPVISAQSLTELKKYPVIVVLGSASSNPLASEFIRSEGLILPENAEGYIIKHFVSGGSDVFLASGSSPRGTYYAAQSFIQLLKREDEHLGIMKADVSDYPSFRFRISGNDESVPGGEIPVEAVKWLSAFKLNGWAAGQSYHWPRDWRRTPEDKLEAFGRAARFSSTGLIDITAQLHPFGRADDHGLFETINIHREFDAGLLTGLMLGFLSSGVKNILLRADDFHELTDFDKQIFGSKALAHSYLLNKVYSRVRSEYPSAGFFFCPPYYTGKELAGSSEKSDYFKILSSSIHPDIVMLWTGPEVCSFRIKAEDVRNFRSHYPGELMLWDNTVYRCRSKFGYEYEYAYYFLHPFSTSYPDDFHELVSGIRYNYGYDGTEISKIANITLADYLWNPAAYKPDSSLEAALSAVAGPGAVEPVLRFAGMMRNAFDLFHSPSRILVLDEPRPPAEFLEILSKIKNITGNAKFAEELTQRFFLIKESISDLRNTYLMLTPPPETLAEINFGDAVISTSGAWTAGGGEMHSKISFPFNTVSSGGAYGSLEVKNLSIAESGTGNYYLVFISDDSYNKTEWPGYIFSQVLIGGEVVWEKDIAEKRSLKPEVVDITGIIPPGRVVDIVIRGYDKKGVHNLGADIGFSKIFVTGRAPESIKKSGNG